MEITELENASKLLDFVINATSTGANRNLLTQVNIDLKTGIQKLKDNEGFSHNELRDLIDIVWQEATESDDVPSTKWVTKMIAESQVKVKQEVSWNEAFGQYANFIIERGKPTPYNNWLEENYTLIKK